MTTREHIEDLVAAGFVVVSADYTLCPQLPLYDGPLQDARSVYAWCKTELPAKMAVEHVKVDPARVVAVGYSAGATLALCLVRTLNILPREPGLLAVSANYYSSPPPPSKGSRG